MVQCYSVSYRFYIGETIEPVIGKRNEAARALTPGALNAQILDVAKDFYSVGFPVNSLVTTYAIAQMMHESDWMTSNLANEDRNYSGIKFLNKSYQDATRGIPAPKNEGGGNYAHFSDFRKWAKDFLRILSLNRSGHGRPIDSSNAAEYIERLRANGYFTDPNYHTKFNAALRKVGEALNFGKSQDQKFLQQYNNGQTTFTETAGKGLTSNESFNLDRNLKKLEAWAKDHPVLATAAGVGVAAALFKLFKR